MRPRAVLLLLALALLCAPAAALARDPLDIDLFARVGQPGQPEGIAVGRDGTVFVSTNQQSRGDTDAPSRIFAYSPRGRLVRQWIVRGQDLSQPHGIQGLAVDGDGLVYALDRAERDRVFTLDPRTGRQRDYAVFPDVPPCPGGEPNGNCSATVSDMPPAPNFPAFGPDGTLYVTDIEQAVIYRVPKGGGRPTVFFTDPRLESPFGPNGIQMMRDGRTLMFAVTGDPPQTGTPASGRLWKLPVRADGRAGELSEFWVSRPVDGPDGFAIGRSGKVYLALAAASQLAVISPQGETLARVPSPTNQSDPPFDGPASVAFKGQSALVTNQSYPAGDPSHWAVFDVFAAEPGQPLFRPRIFSRAGSRGRARARVRLRLRLVYERGRDRRGRRCAVGRVRAKLRGRGLRRVRRVVFRFDRVRVAVDRRRPFTAIVHRPRRGQRARRHRVRARVALRGGGRRAAARRVRTCRRARA